MSGIDAEERISSTYITCHYCWVVLYMLCLVALVVPTKLKTSQSVFTCLVKTDVSPGPEVG